MKSYILFIFSLCAVLSVLSMIPVSETLEKTKKTVFSVILMAALAVPLASVVPDALHLLSSLPDGVAPSDSTPAYAERAEASFAAGIAAAVAEEFSLPASDVRVTLSDFDFSAMCAGRVNVFLSGAAVYGDAPGIRRYIEKEGWGTADVTVEFG